MKLKFGPGIGNDTFSTEDWFNNLQKALDFSDEAAELSLTDSNEVEYDSMVCKLFRRFKYRSIHLPVVTLTKGVKDFLKYPDIKHETFLKLIDKIIEDTDPDTILVHPDQVNDFQYFNLRYGDKLAFENMDSRKDFGKTVEDMKKVFQLSPQAKWVFDVNHIYTNDETMALSNNFYSELKEKIAHYHLSGFGGFHDALSISQEDIILEGIKSIEKPIIDEGDLIKKNVLQSEYLYVKDRLGKKFDVD